MPLDVQCVMCGVPHECYPCCFSPTLLSMMASCARSGHDVSKLVTSAWLVYAFAIVAPVVLWVAFNQLGIPVKLIQASLLKISCLICVSMPVRDWGRLA